MVLAYGCYDKHEMLSEVGAAPFHTTSPRSPRERSASSKAVA